MSNNKEAKVYYEVVLDSYNQPSGEILEVRLTDEEYERLSRCTHFIYPTYREAVARVMD